MSSKKIKILKHKTYELVAFKQKRYYCKTGRLICLPEFVKSQISHFQTFTSHCTSSGLFHLSVKATLSLFSIS